MPAGNGYSIGQDNSIVLIDSVQGKIVFPIVTDFDVRETSKTVSVQPMSGPELRDELPQGWEGSFGVDRASTSVDDYFTTRAATYFATNTLSVVTMYQYITEVNGSTSCWECTGCTLKLSDGGKFAGPETVKVKISWYASRRVRVS